MLALPQALAFHVALPGELLRLCSDEGDQVRYQVVVAAAEPGRVPGAGVDMYAPAGLDALQHADTVIVPGGAALAELEQPAAVLDALGSAARRGARMVSFCAGAFVLAAADLLDGHRATTHWMLTDDLAARHPRVTVDASALFVDDSTRFTAAGGVAAVDLLLHLVRLDHGAAEANRVARRMVAPPLRAGGQAQYVEARLPAAGGTGLDDVRNWALTHLHEPLSVPALAARAGLSREAFSRRFRAETGDTPMRWVNHQRVYRAQQLLEVTDLPVESIAARVGFPNGLVLRKNFRSVTKTTPGAYRATFREPADRARSARHEGTVGAVP